MKRIVVFSLLACWQIYLYAGYYEVLSPNGKLKVVLTVSDVLGMEVFCDGQSLFTASNVGICLQQQPFKPQVCSVKRLSANEIIKPVVPLKFASVANRYHALHLNLKGNLAIEVRAYDDGVAYRFVTDGRRKKL